MLDVVWTRRRSAASARGLEVEAGGCEPGAVAAVVVDAAQKARRSVALACCFAHAQQRGLDARKHPFFWLRIAVPTYLRVPYVPPSCRICIAVPHVSVSISSCRTNQAQPSSALVRIAVPDVHLPPNDVRSKKLAVKLRVSISVSVSNCRPNLPRLPTKEAGRACTLSI